MPDKEPCVKTAKGIEEIEKRTVGLPLKERRVLIMVDGARDRAGIAALFPQEDVGAILAKLRQEGFISQPEPPAAAAGVVPPVDEAQRFHMAQNFMINSTNHFLGPSGPSLIAKLRVCRDMDALRALYGDWRSAIVTGGAGGKQLPDLEGRLTALLG